MTDKRILYIFTRTPLHVGAGASVGAIDQPIQRERHTGFPIIPASSLKGPIADLWNGELLDVQNGDGKKKMARVNADGKRTDAAWLFGSDSDKHAAAGALQFSEARIIAFPIRSAKGSFAWISCPLMLQRAARDGALKSTLIEKLTEPKDGEAIFDVSEAGKLNLDGQIVLEEYTFKSAAGWAGLAELARAMAELLRDDPVWKEVNGRLVVISNGMMSYFAQNACEVAQHVRINDETGTAEGGALFNQENVPSETIFYSVVNAFDERGANGVGRKAEEAWKALTAQIANLKNTLQFGGDASTGLGYCTVQPRATKENNQ